jgi:hypothetical protein
MQKQDPLAFGPLQLNTAVPWDGFLQSIVGEVESAPVNLVILSLKWRLMKPANSTWMPLRSATGYASLVKQMASARALNIIIQMGSTKSPCHGFACECVLYLFWQKLIIIYSCGHLQVHLVHQSLLSMSTRCQMMIMNPVARRYGQFPHPFVRDLTSSPQAEVQ